MKVFACLILFILQSFFCSSIAQTNISRTICAAENGMPIEGAVVQFGDLQNDYIISDKNGKFSLPHKHNDILFIQCIGYTSKSVLSLNLLKNNIILLELSPIELNPVEVTPIDFDIILTKAIANLKNKLITNSYLLYSLQLKQKEEYSGEEQEVKLRYAACLEKVKNKNLPFILKKVDIEKIKVLPDNATSGSLKKNTFNIEYHLKSLDSKYFIDKYKVTKSNTEDGLIVLSALPQNKQTQEYVDYRFYISEVDTILQSIHINVDYKNSEDGYKSFGTRKYKVNKTNTEIKFAEKDGNYYLIECLQILEILLNYKDGRKEKIISYSDTKLAEFNNIIPSNIEKSQKLNGFSRELFSK